MFGFGRFLHSIKVGIVGKNALGKPVKNAIGDLNKLKKAIGQLKAIGKKMMFIGGVMTAAMVPGIVSAAGFENAMAEVSTLVDTATVDIGGLGEQVKDMSKEFGSMPTDTARAFYQTVSAGFSDAADATEIMTVGLKLARGGVTDTATAVDGLTSILNAYGLSGEDALSVSDSLFVAMRMGKTTIGALSSTIGRVAPLAKAAGVGIDEMTAGVAALTLGGLNTAEATTSFRAMMSGILKPTADATAVAKEFGITLSTAGIKSVGGFSNWLKILQEKMGGNEVALARLFPNVRALVGALALVGPQGQKYAEIMEAMGIKTGSTATAFAKMDATTKAAFDKSKASAAAAMHDIFKAMLPTITSLLTVIGKIGSGIGAFAKAHPMLTKILITSILVTGIFLTLAGTVVFLAASFAFAVVSLAAYSLASKSAAMGSLGLAAALKGVAIGIWSILWPVGLVILAIAGLSVIGYQLWKHWDSITAGLGAAFRAICGAFLIASQAISGAAVKLWGMLGAGFKWIWEFVRDMVLSLGMGIAVGMDFITNVFSIGLSYISGLWSSTWAGIAEAFGGVWETIKGHFTAVWQWVVALPSRFYEAGKGLIAAFLDGIKAAWSGLVTNVKNMFSELRSYLPFSDAKKGPLSDLTKSGFRFVETFQRGIHQSFPSLERELDESLMRLIPVPVGAGGGSINNIDNSRQSDGGRTNHYTVTVNITGTSDKDIEKKVKQGIMQALNETGKDGGR